MAPLHSLSPECGERTLPGVIDSVAETDGGRPIISIPKDDDKEDGYVDVSFSEFAKAVDYCSWWMDDNIKGKGHKVFYFGPLDIRYLIVMLASCKTGRVAFFSSHRNSLEAHLSLLDTTRCETVLVPKNAPVALKQILAKKHMEQLDFPELQVFLESNRDVKKYKYEAKFSKVKDDPFVILHTSGSTGIPKPVYVTHGTFASNDAHQLIPSLGGRPTVVDYLRGRRILVSLPLFHAACIGMWANGVFSAFTPVIPPVGPLTADVVDIINSKADISGSLLPPSLIIDIYNNPEFLENMVNQLDFISYVGGTLDSDVGKYLSRNLKLITLFGTTENMYYPLEIHDRPIDWSYISLSPQLGHAYQEWKDDLGELVILRDSSKGKFQGVFSTFPDTDEYRTKDLYEPHPTRSNLWKFSGRSDDIICFNNAEKLNPITMETIIGTHREVKTAVIGGNGQFQASVLIEPKTHPKNQQEEQELIERIWPTIVKANQSCPAHGRLVRNLVMLSDPERPLPMAGKATVQRFAAMEMYKKDFEDVYSKKPAPASANRAKSSSPEAKNSEHTITSVKDDVRQKAYSPEYSWLNSESQHKLQDMIRNALPELFGSVVADMARNMLGPVASTKATTKSQPQSQRDDDVEIKKAAANEKPGESEAPRKQPVVNGNKANGAYEDIGEIKDALHEALAKTTYLDKISDDSNFFDHGLDSIQVSGFVDEVNNTIVGESKERRDPVKLKEVYRNPTVTQLASALD